VKDIVPYLKTNFIFILYLRSAVLYTVLAIGMTFFFLSGTLIAESGGMALFEVGNLQLPIFLVEQLLSLYQMVTAIILLFVVIGLADTMLYGQLVEVIVARNQKRWLHITGFLVVVFIFLLLVNIVFWVAGLKLGLSFFSAVMFYTSSTLGYLFVALALIFLMNYDRTRRNAVLILILLLFFFPFVIDLSYRFLNFGFANTAVQYVLIFTGSVLKTHSNLSSIASEILLRDHINWSSFFINLATISMLWLSICLVFVRKEFQN